MSEIKETITEQLQRLQMLMHRALFQGNAGSGRTRNPHRGQGRVLAMLKIKPEISQRDLTYLLGMSKQSIAELLTKLEKSGYITRTPSENDKRVMMIKLTDAGMKAAENIEDTESESTRAFDCLNEKELETFSEYLGRIIKQYEEQFPGEDFEQRHRAMEEFVTRHGTRRGFYGQPEGPDMENFGRGPGGNSRCGARWGMERDRRREERED